MNIRMAVNALIEASRCLGVAQADGSEKEVLDFWDSEVSKYQNAVYESAGNPFAASSKIQQPAKGEPCLLCGNSDISPDYGTVDWASANGEEIGNYNTPLFCAECGHAWRGEFPFSGGQDQ